MFNYLANRPNKTGLIDNCSSGAWPTLRVLCTVYTKYSKVIIKHSVNGHLVSMILFMQFSTFKLGIHGNKHTHIAIIYPLT